MIAFDLCCHQNHTFEVWFQDGKSYELQHAQGLLECPVCGSTVVRKVLPAVAIHTGSRPEEGETSVAVLHEIMLRVYRAVEKDTEDVGTDFAKEALKMHFRVTEPRNIRGVATAEEEKTLRDEGVRFMKIPVPARNSTGEN